MSRMQVVVLEECGWRPALVGVSLSYGLYKRDDTLKNIADHLEKVAQKLAHKQGGHNKFLESIYLWLWVKAPRYWWQQADTYRLSTKQSESTMHTLLGEELTQDHFAAHVPEYWLAELNSLIKDKQLDKAKQYLPEAFLQERIWCLNYKCLQNIYAQRKTHKLIEWELFLDSVLDQIETPEYIVGCRGEK